MAVSNIGLLGCLPEEIRVFGRNASGCVDSINNYVQLFNQKLKVLIDDLNTNLPKARFIISNQTSISTGGPPIGRLKYSFILHYSLIYLIITYSYSILSSFKKE